jgi:hypothetical protein
VPGGAIHVRRHCAGIHPIKRETIDHLQCRDVARRSGWRWPRHRPQQPAQSRVTEDRLAEGRRSCPILDLARNGEKVIITSGPTSRLAMTLMAGTVQTTGARSSLPRA